MLVKLCIIATVGLTLACSSNGQSSGAGGASPTGGAAGSSGEGTGGQGGGTFLRRHIDVGFQFGCAIRQDGSIACWGDPELEPESTQPPAGTYTHLSCRTFTCCALDGRGYVECWGGLAGLASSGNEDVDVSVSSDQTCLVAGDRTGYCRTAAGQVTTQPGPFRQIAAGNADWACGVLESGELSCWGSYPDAYDITRPPSGRFSMVSMGNVHACAIAESGALSCWGAGTDPELTGTELHYGQSIPPAGTFVSVSAGAYYNCALRTDGSIECWGQGTDADGCPESSRCGQAAPPSGTFREVAGQHNHSCAVRDDGSVTCWGYDANARLDAPADLRVLE
jgi:hypothetical protein